MYKTLSVFILLATLNGCAYVVNSKMVKVPVVTTPEGATLTVNNRKYNSPATVLIPRGAGDFVLLIEKEGFQSVEIVLKQSIDIALAGNALSFGPLGLAVDFISGYAYDIEPDLIKANLKGAKVSKLDDGTLNLVLIDINDLPKQLASKIKKSPRFPSSQL